MQKDDRDQEEKIVSLQSHHQVFRTLSIDPSSILLIEYGLFRTPEASCNKNCIIIAGEPIHYNNFI